MAILRWVPELDTGIDEIDVQHRRIVDYINRLYALRDSPDRDGLGEVIAEMVDYTISHFAFEEGVMENAGYMFAGPHKRVHELFTRKVAEMQSRFDAGENVTQVLHGLLSRWLFNHIRNEDHGYVDSVHAYQRMLVNQRNADMAHMKEEVLRELKAERSKRSWWARLFGG